MKVTFTGMAEAYKQCLHDGTVFLYGLCQVVNIKLSVTCFMCLLKSSLALYK